MDSKSINRNVSMKWVVPVTAVLLMWPTYVFAYKVVTDVTADWCFAHNGDVWIADDENGHGDCIMERVKPGSTLGDIQAAAHSTTRNTALVDCRKSGYCTVRMSNGRVQKIRAAEVSTVKLDSSSVIGPDGPKR
jgi:hypothetical protein